DLLFIPVIGPVTYTVKAGDSVASVAAAFQINPLAILNPAGQPISDPLMPGDALTVQFGDAALAASIKAAGNVILNGEITTAQQGGGMATTLVSPLGPFAATMRGFGLTNIQAEADGAVHSILAYQELSG